MRFGEFENGYSVGWEDGRTVGFQEGVYQMQDVYEHRLAAFWAELQTLNARLDYLDKVIHGRGHNE